MARGAPKGNQNAAKAKVWEGAIHRALTARSKLEGRQILEDAAMALVNKALEGDIPALKELGDRLDGKPTQSISNEDGSPLLQGIKVIFVGSAAS